MQRLYGNMKKNDPMSGRLTAGWVSSYSSLGRGDGPFSPPMVSMRETVKTEELTSNKSPFSRFELFAWDLRRQLDRFCRTAGYAA